MIVESVTAAFTAGFVTSALCAAVALQGAFAGWSFEGVECHCVIGFALGPLPNRDYCIVNVLKKCGNHSNCVIWSNFARHVKVWWPLFKAGAILCAYLL